MTFTAQSVWEMTTLFIRDPAEASRRVLRMRWPLNVSVWMIVLAGVAAGIMWALNQVVFGAGPMLHVLPDGREIMVAQATPVAVGVYTALIGVILSYMIYWVGKRAGGRGTLPEVMAVMAALQIALTVLGVLSGLVGLVVPILGVLTTFFVFYVTVRGYGHGVMQAHRYPSFGRPIMVIFFAFFISGMILSVVALFLAPFLMPELISEIQNDV